MKSINGATVLFSGKNEIFEAKTGRFYRYCRRSVSDRVARIGQVAANLVTESGLLGAAEKLSPDLTFALYKELIGCQLLKSHRATTMQLVGADPNFGTHAEFTAISESS
jgi:hypothetical protein